MKCETITWHELPGDGLPDADVTVLAQTRQSDGSLEVWPAFWSGERWVDAGSGWAIEYGDVAAWADVPGGPDARVQPLP